MTSYWLEGDSQGSLDVIHNACWAGGQHGMVRAYSMDLRERVLAAVIDEGMSARGAAARFGISESSAIKWLKRHQQTGSVAPAQIGGYKPRLLTGDLRDWLLDRTRPTSPCAGWLPSWPSAA